MDQAMLRVVGFEQGTCGCIFARYQFVSGSHVSGGRELVYVEAPATGCGRHHRSARLDDIPADRSSEPLILYAHPSAS